MNMANTGAKKTSADLRRVEIAERLTGYARERGDNEAAAHAASTYLGDQMRRNDQRCRKSALRDSNNDQPLLLKWERSQ